MQAVHNECVWGCISQCFSNGGLEPKILLQVCADENNDKWKYYNLTDHMQLIYK